MTSSMRVGPIVVMGVAGSGKTTIGTALAQRLGVRFVDADDLHPPANVAKMTAGIPLDDSDRWPWLARTRQELRGGDVVVTCSALKRRYRDLLRQADGVRFVHLDVDRSTAEDRAGARPGHFMASTMVASQFEALEPPAADETDIAVVDGSPAVDQVVASIDRHLLDLRSGSFAMPDVAVGGADFDLDDELTRLVAQLIDSILLRPRCGRVLLVPPDHTRLHSRAGTITVELLRGLEGRGITVGVLPALGTHVRMSPADTAALFGPDLESDRLMHHDWRSHLRPIGEITSDEISTITAGAFDHPIPIEVDEQLFGGWDLVVSIGQVVPHEVIGMANFTKNVVIGLGGAPTIHRSHFVGAVVGMERIMGRTSSAVRDVVDAAFDRFVDPVVPVLFVLTVVEDIGDRTVLRGVFAGGGGSASAGGAAFRAAASLARTVNLDIVPTPLDRVVCWLDPLEFHSMWLGNKAVYRTRMAIADGGELYVLAPGVRRFGEDPHIDELIRQHGYRGTPATLAAVRSGGPLAANLAAAAHLIHGSSEDRFRIVWCTDPESGLRRDEVEDVGYDWCDLAVAIERFAVDGSMASGPMADRSGARFQFIANPALGLWSTGARFAGPGGDSAETHTSAPHDTST